MRSASDNLIDPVFNWNRFAFEGFVEHDELTADSMVIYLRDNTRMTLKEAFGKARENYHFGYANTTVLYIVAIDFEGDCVLLDEFDEKIKFDLGGNMLFMDNYTWQVDKTIKVHGKYSLFYEFYIFWALHYYQKREYALVVEFINEALNKFVKLDEKLRFKFTCLLAESLRRSGKGVESLDTFEEAKDIYNQLAVLNQNTFSEIYDEKDALDWNHSRLIRYEGFVYQYNLTDYENAISCYLDALRIESNLDNKPMIETLYADIGLSYLQLGDVNLCLEYYDKSLDILNTTNNISRKMLVLRNKARAFQYGTEFKLAIKNATEALTLAVSNKNPEAIAYAYEVLGRTYRFLGKLDKAKDNFEKCYEIQKNWDNQYRISYALFELINLSHELNQQEFGGDYLTKLKAIKQKNKNSIVKELDNARYKIAKTKFLIAEKQYKEAKDLLRDVISNDKITPELTAYALLSLSDTILKMDNNLASKELKNLIPLMSAFFEKHSIHSLRDKCVILNNQLENSDDLTDLTDFFTEDLIQQKYVLEIKQ